jgi:hypothetical protein
MRSRRPKSIGSSIDECHFAEEGHRMAAMVFAPKLVPLL